MKRVLILTVVLLALVFAFGPTSVPQNSSLIVQARDVETAVAVAQEYGGQVHEVLDIINAVSVLVPDSQVMALKADNRVTVYTDDLATSADNHNGDDDDDNNNDSNRNNSLVGVRFPQVLGADEVWDEDIDGSGITIAVVDSGIAKMDWNRQRVLETYNAVDDGLNRQKDPYGHGTMMASLAGSDGEYKNHEMGIAPGVDFVNVRVLDNEGKGYYTDIIEGLNWILQHQAEYNIRVVNLSIVGGVSSPYWADPINQAVEVLWDAGIVVVAAAGNGGSDPLTIASPGNDPFVITVGAFTDNYTWRDESDDFVTPFSGAGPTEVGFVKPDMIAPGAHMMVNVKNDSEWAREHPEARIRGNNYQIAGTSAATAVTSGVVALMLEANPNMTPNQVKYALMNSARPAAYTDSSLAWSILQQGAGRVDAATAVLNPPVGEANVGMSIDEKYVGPIVYRDGKFIVVDENGNEIPEAAGYSW
ncbi:MAG: S8 family peptidase, partial [Chloroflexi bacterium]|nr:S8 family peptidase [Chloroflexota bacterium]MBP7592202.1 S8 family peptidase [Chloroflexota bacterium]